jgi:hypothetical protein
MNNESKKNGLWLSAAAGLILVSGTCLSAGTTGANCPDNVDVEWSLDIGSDSELSDPAMNGNERVDPGDAYWWHGPGLPPGGADGIRDDFFAFGAFDPFPDAPDPALVTAAPSCSGIPITQIFSQYFDMDAHDNLDLNIIQFLPADQGLPPVAQFPSTCIWEAKHLIISFDDDRELPYTDCGIPVTTASPMGFTYGTTAAQDEIVAVTVTGPVAPASVVNIFGLSDEKSLDISLAPNPDNLEEEDDDVDSLDVYPHDDDSCQYWYFSPDHEATGTTPAGLPLDPGSIYLATAAGPLQIVDDVTHLGLLESTDVDAFEFVWLEATNIPGDPAGAGLAFAVLFSVDDDDPTTAIDESGGLNPRQIYASYMNGFSFAFLDDPLRDDVDALTNYCLELQPPTTAPCDGDANGDGVIDVNDLSYVLFRLGNVAPPSPVDGDVNGDLIVDVNDISYVLFRLGNPC